MPVIEISLPEESLTTDRQEQLVNTLSNIVLKWEGALGNPRAAAGTLAYLYEAKTGTFAIGGKLQQPTDPARYRVVITVPFGGFNAERKLGLVEEVTRAMLEAEGAPYNDLNRFRVLCLIQEVPEGNWGSGGQILRLLDIARILGVDPNSPRYKELEAALT